MAAHHMPYESLLEALRLDFNVISASEMEPSYRDLCNLNYPGKIGHFYRTLEEQIKERSICENCSGSLQSEVLGACKPKEDLTGSEIDVLFSGSPCDPFSQQRSKRWVEGNVKSHHQFETTMTEMAHLYLAYEPLKMIFEQVLGFTMPFEKNGTQTPKDLSLDIIGDKMHPIMIDKFIPPMP